MPILGNNMHGEIRSAEFRHGEDDKPLRASLEARIDNALGDLKTELLRAMTKHRPMASAHEGHSVIREEFEELWEHVMHDTGDTREARKEAMQIAAMGLRYALDICTEEAMRAQEIRSGP